jgi:hypothetical protein
MTAQPDISRRGFSSFARFTSQRLARFTAVASAGLLGLLPSAVATPPAPCKGSLKLVGACYMVHGRATYGPGTPALRIWPVGTHRMLGITAGRVADDADAPIIPQNFVIESGKREAWGDFEVCPFTPERTGAMQMVCVESVKHLSQR